MSFILESLQRVQKDQRKGHAPNLEEVYGDSSILPRRKRRWPWVIAMVLVVSGGAAGYLLWPKSPAPDVVHTLPAEMKVAATPKAASPPPKAAVKKAAPRAASPSPKAAAKKAAPRAASPSPKAPARKAAPRAASPPPKAAAKKAAPRAASPSPAAPIKKAAPKAASPSPAVPAKKAAPRAASSTPQKIKDARPLAMEAKVTQPPPPPVDAQRLKPDPDVTEKDLPAAEAGHPKIAAERTKESVDRPADKKPVKKSQVITSDVDDAIDRPPVAKKPEPALDLEGIPLVRDLPAEIRHSLSDLKINVHGYFEDPDRRVVFINMRRYRVGDLIGEEKYVLEAITPEGVVINYGEGRVRLLVRR